MIIVENLNKKFGELEVLRDISETIHDGEKIVIVGPSGSGKSTFLRCLNLLERPTSGTITIDDVDILTRKRTSMTCEVKWEWCFRTSTCFLT